MKKDGLKSELQRIFDVLKELEARARKLDNQNLADIAALAHGRVKQLCDHPDTELVTDEEPKEELPFDPNAGSAATREHLSYKAPADGQSPTVTPAGLAGHEA